MINLTFVAPFFIVKDVKTSVAFYVDQLGFKVRYMGPDGDPFFAMVGRDDISIMLKAIAADIQPVPNHTRHPWASWDAYISTTDPDILYEEYRSDGVSFHQHIQVNGDNIRGFSVADADGYVLFFGQPNTSNTIV